mgnify:CR=1 FL=1
MSTTKLKANLLIILFVVAFILSACSGSTSSNSSPVVSHNAYVLGTLPNGSTVYVNESVYYTESGDSTDGILWISGGVPGQSYTFSFTTNESGPSVSSQLNPCTITSGTSTLCQLTFSANSASPGDYSVTVSYAKTLANNQINQTSENVALPNAITFIVRRSLAWSRQVGANGGGVEGSDVSADLYGNIYISGVTSVAFSGESLIGNSDYFIAKYTESGALLWTRLVGAESGNTVGYGVNSDIYGNAYIVGATAASLSGESKTGFFDYFIAKYTESGDLLWTRQVGGQFGFTYALAVTTDTGGNAYITGYTNVAISGQPHTGSQNYFIAKYTESGHLVWTHEVGGISESASTAAFGISGDESGNIYITGNTTASLSNQPKVGDIDYFIAKYHSDGALIWTKEMGVTGGTTQGEDISTDINGNSYISGLTNVGLSGESQMGIYDYFIAKYTENGTLLWTRQVGANNGEAYGLGISVDFNDNAYITGYTNVGLSGEKQIGNQDYFVAKYTKSGTLLWSRQVGTKGTNNRVEGQNVSADLNGNAYVVGITSVSLSGQAESGPLDYFIAKYYP